MWSSGRPVSRLLRSPGVFGLHLAPTAATGAVCAARPSSTVAAGPKAGGTDDDAVYAPSTTHYEGQDVLERILQVLQAQGKSTDPIASVEDLVAADQFHTRGKQATESLMNLAGISEQDFVLDVGCGLGGPARALVAARCCYVHGIDLSPGYVRTAAELARRTRLADRVAFSCANALALPFPAGTFSVVWTQHVSMNIADKRRLYSECRRVLRPGGRFAFNDVLAGPRAAPGRSLAFPVPWARSAADSHLLPLATVRALLAECGLRERVVRDHSEAAAVALRKAVAALPRDSSARLGLHLVLGEQAAGMLGNLAAALEDGVAAVVEGVFVAGDEGGADAAGQA